MKRIIDIDEELYEVYKGRPPRLGDEGMDMIAQSIANSVPYEERPQGKWVVQRLQNWFDDVYCPFCNARPTRSEYGYYLKDNFCHECGADMRVRVGDRE